MARLNKVGIDYFPKCKPHMITKSRLGSFDKEVKYKAYRNISSSFIKRKDVRNSILKRDNYKCIICGSSENLEIDHIVSVVYASNNNMSIDELNKKSNLQVLCQSCNARKKP